MGVLRPGKRSEKRQTTPANNTGSLVPLADPRVRARQPRASPRALGLRRRVPALLSFFIFFLGSELVLVSSFGSCGRRSSDFALLQIGRRTDRQKDVLSDPKWIALVKCAFCCFKWSFL